MSKYIKLFENENEYKTFTGSTEFIKPNVSAVISGDTVHYNGNGEEPTPTFEGKWKAEYQNGEVRSATCGSDNTIQEYEIPRSLEALYYQTKLEIGSCVGAINGQIYSYHNDNKADIIFYNPTPPNIAYGAFGGWTGVEQYEIYVPDSAYDSYINGGGEWVNQYMYGKIHKMSERPNA